MSQLVTTHYPLSLDAIPDGWELVALGEVIKEIQVGFSSGKHNSKGEGIPHLRPMNISPAGELDFSNSRYISTDNPLRLSAGDILFNNTNSPAWVGKTALVETGVELAFSNHMTRLRVASGIEPALLAKQLHLLCSSGYFLHHCRKHVNQASISRTFLAKSTPILIPPAAEQNALLLQLQLYRPELAERATCSTRLSNY